MGNDLLFLKCPKKSADNPYHITMPRSSKYPLKVGNKNKGKNVDIVNARDEYMKPWLNTSLVQPEK